jgi:hypothetical protein
MKREAGDRAISRKRLLRRLADKDSEIARLRSAFAGSEVPRIKPHNIIWVFGSGRTGSSWLTSMMGDLPYHSRWNEPLVGHLFGHLYYVRAAHRSASKYFVLSDDYRSDSIRVFTLHSATTRFPERTEGGYLVIKEPHGSIGAPLLMEALPESRMIFLVRDPRDVAASAMDAHRKGSRDLKARWGREPRAHELVENDPDAFVRLRAETYLRDIQYTKRAYESHAGHKVLVRYEDLRTNTLAEMKRIYEALEISVTEEELARVSEKFAWESIPQDEKGPGKLRRKAKPGGWREDLTPIQVEIIERIDALILKEFYR